MPGGSGGPIQLRVVPRRGRPLGPVHRRTPIFLALGVVAGLFASRVTPHGIITKPLFNGTAKANATTRGAVTTQANQLYFMIPAAHVSGYHKVVGYEITCQDEEGGTEEYVDLSIVKFAANGADPDETTSGELHRATYKVFGFTPGRNAFIFLLTIGFEINAPHRHGMGIGLPAEPSWPTDGLSVQAQLNLPGDPLRPRVLPPYDQEVWTFERPLGAAQAAALGGRTLDTLSCSLGYFGSILQMFSVSSAYGGPRETLLGPEALYPVASRGDSVGINIHGRDPAIFPIMAVLMAPRLRTTPLLVVTQPETGYLYLDPLPLILSWHALDVQGKATVGPFPASVFPAGLREWYFQGVNLSLAGRYEMSDAVGFLGQ